MWTDSELESSVLFEVPKENLNYDCRSPVENTPSPPAEQIKDREVTSDDKDKSINRSRDHLTSNEESIVEAADENANKDDGTNTNYSNVKSSKRSERSKSVSFQGPPKHKPVNIATLGLRRCPRLLTQEIKKLDATLNHEGFTHAIDSLEKDTNPTK